MKACLRKKCQKEFEPNKPKQVFCSAKCRVYNGREKEKKDEPIPISIPLDVDSSVISTPSGSRKLAQMVADMKKNEVPRLKGESSIDYRLRVLELSENNKK